MVSWVRVWQFYEYIECNLDFYFWKKSYFQTVFIFKNLTSKTFERFFFVLVYPGLSYPEGVLSQMLMSLSARHHRQTEIPATDLVKEEHEDKDEKEIGVDGGHLESPEISSTQGKSLHASLNGKFYEILQRSQKMANPVIPVMRSLTLVVFSTMTVQLSYIHQELIARQGDDGRHSPASSSWSWRRSFTAKNTSV